jgi:hypothetical protein
MRTVQQWTIRAIGYIAALVLIIVAFGAVRQGSVVALPLTVDEVDRKGGS